MAQQSGVDDELVGLSEVGEFFLCGGDDGRRKRERERGVEVERKVRASYLSFVAHLPALLEDFVGAVIEDAPSFRLGEGLVRVA